ncbi:hypothetical protein JCGZ_13812 [Jatropha curcas]|uniref:Uncharacterized protein n=1 Tax=Jatropha curcas TaxID=180498 RepID=A0A067KJ01_JATCU|nr:hypothetical protein JCGZ_13812 [Jatropha curcas]
MRFSTAFGRIDWPETALTRFGRRRCCFKRLRLAKAHVGAVLARSKAVMVRSGEQVPVPGGRRHAGVNGATDRGCDQLALRDLAEEEIEQLVGGSPLLLKAFDDQKISTTSAPSSSMITSDFPTEKVLLDNVPLIPTPGAEKVSYPSDVDLCDVNNKFSSLGYLLEGDRTDSDFLAKIDDLKKAGSMIAEKLSTGNVDGNLNLSSSLGFIKVTKKQRNRKVKTAIELLKPTRRQKKTQASFDCIRPNEYNELES